MHHQEVRRRGHQRHRLEILDRIIGKIAVQARVHRQLRGQRQRQRVAIVGRLGDHIHADVAVGPAMVVHDDALAHPLREVQGERTRNRIAAAPDRIRHDHAHGAVWIGVGGRGGGHGGGCAKPCRGDNPAKLLGNSVHDGVSFCFRYVPAGIQSSHPLARILPSRLSTISGARPT